MKFREFNDKHLRQIIPGHKYTVNWGIGKLEVMVLNEKIYGTTRDVRTWTCKIINNINYRGVAQINDVENISEPCFYLKGKRARYL